MRFSGLLVVLAVAVGAATVSRGAADEPADARAYWVYEGGWFAQSKDGTWYEMNELTLRKLGKPVKFKEARRAKDVVELFDEARKVSVRLYAEKSEVRVSDAADAVWEPLYKGRWKTPDTGE